MFKGKKRELVAQDVVYSYLRFLDPKNRAPYAFLLEGKIVGLDEHAAAAKKSGKFDYDAKIPGIEAVDRYTLRFRLKETDYNFLFVAAHISLGIVAREVIEGYADDTMAHPVGTGPYMLTSWTRRSKIVLEANPEYRGFTWDFAVSEPGVGRRAREGHARQADAAGRAKVEITIIEEAQSRWLAFQQKQLDYFARAGDVRAERARRRSAQARARRRGHPPLPGTPDPDMTYTAFNIRDPVIGGFSKEKIALRRAMAMAYDIEDEIKVVRKGQAVALQMPIPAGVIGHDPSYRSVNQYDPVTANKLLDYFGYKKGKDGWRTLPDGKPLLIRLATEPQSTQRELDEVWQKSLAAIGVRMEQAVAPFVDNVQASKACKLQMWGQGWIADYPDGDNFLQLLYGPNTGQSNNGCYESAAFDKFYVASRAIPDSPERNRLYLEMSRQMEVDAAWSLHVSRMRSELIRPWIQGYKKHPILQADWQYLDVVPH